MRIVTLDAPGGMLLDVDTSGVADAWPDAATGTEEGSLKIPCTVAAASCLYDLQSVILSSDAAVIVHTISHSHTWLRYCFNDSQLASGYSRSSPSALSADCQDSHRTVSCVYKQRDAVLLAEFPPAYRAGVLNDGPHGRIAETIKSMDGPLCAVAAAHSRLAPVAARLQHMVLSSTCCDDPLNLLQLIDGVPLFDALLNLMIPRADRKPDLPSLLLLIARELCDSKPAWLGCALYSCRMSTIREIVTLPSRFPAAAFPLQLVVASVVDLLATHECLLIGEGALLEINCSDETGTLLMVLLGAGHYVPASRILTQLASATEHVKFMYLSVFDSARRNTMHALARAHGHDGALDACAVALHRMLASMPAQTKVLMSAQDIRVCTCCCVCACVCLCDFFMLCFTGHDRVRICCRLW